MSHSLFKFKLSDDGMTTLKTILLVQKLRAALCRSPENMNVFLPCSPDEDDTGHLRKVVSFINKLDKEQKRRK
jgi:hypothetical protein